ncbi:MAG: 16S rRNA (uracil(1498)-N(3))-methyltransferase [Eubacterium sp.]|nr:16S rRNA (uracil(1498)-N(3))-methyltransferase [Eubacterium sp.]
MHRFFAERDQIRGSTVLITGQDVTHIRSVLRMKPGERILVVCQDEWEYTCRITEISADSIQAEIEDAQKPGKELPSRIYLFQCLPKGDKMDLIVQKAVELGAFQVIPVSSARSIVRYDKKKAAARVRRWNAISESAAKQAKRMIVPQVAEVISFGGITEYVRQEEIDVCLIPYELAENMEQTRRVLGAVKPGSRIAVLIGPEGGFEPGEADAAVQSGFQAITLGKRILRTETAGLAVLSVLMYLLEQ